MYYSLKEKGICKYLPCVRTWVMSLAIFVPNRSFLMLIYINNTNGRALHAVGSPLYFQRYRGILSVGVKFYKIMTMKCIRVNSIRAINKFTDFSRTSAAITYCQSWKALECVRLYSQCQCTLVFVYLCIDRDAFHPNIVLSWKHLLFLMVKTAKKIGNQVVRKIYVKLSEIDFRTI